MELLRDRRAEFEEAGVQPIGISRDSPWTHIAWTQALDLNFGLLSDWNAEAVHAFGIAHEHRGFVDVARRSAFLVAVFWVGGGILLTVLALGASRRRDANELATIARQAAFVGEKLFAPAGLVVLLMGIAMMINGGGGILQWGKFWVVVGLIGYVIT